MATKKINACVGIEIVDGVMCCSVLTKNKGHVFTQELSSSMVDMGSFSTEKSTGIELKEIFKKQSIKIKDCSLILPNVSAIVKNLEIGVMAPAAIYKSLPLEFQEEGAGPDFLYDFSVSGLKRNLANEVTGMIILAMGADEDYLLDQKDVFKNAALNLHTTTCKEAALANIVRYYRNLGDDLDNQESFCFVEIGYKNTKMHFYKGTVFELTRGLEYGITHIEQAVARSLSIPIEQAEEHVKNPSRIDFNQLEAVVTMFSLLSVEIKKTIAFYNSKSFGNQVNEVICIGQGAKIPSLINAIGQTIGVPFDTATNKLSQGMGITGENFDECVVAIGSALQM